MPGLGLPDLGNEALLATLDDWLRPAFAGRTRLDALSADALADALKTLLDWPLRQTVTQLAPSHVDVTSGQSRALDHALGAHTLQTVVQGKDVKVLVSIRGR